MKKRLSDTWLILRHGAEKYLVKKFKIFVPSSSGGSVELGKHTALSINLIFPLISKLMHVLKIRKSIYKADAFCKKNKKIQESKKLKKLFNYYGSDKSRVHNYHLIYSAIFPKRNKVKKILEIGLGTNNINMISNMGPEGKPGASVRAFRDYFSQASIYGADIDSEILFSEKRIKTYYVDQTNIESIKKLFSKKIGKNFDLIIDDGLHAPYTNLNFLISCMNKINKGGWLVIEDIPFAAKPIWELIDFIMNVKQKSFLVKTKNCYVYLINKKN